MSWKRPILRACGSVIPDLYRPPAGVLFPHAHIVTDVPPPHVRQLYTIPSVAKFQSDLDFLCQNFRPLQLSELEQLPRSRSGRKPAHSFILSFDDGMREVADTVAPMLRAKGIPAIFFVNSATLDNRQMMWRHKISLLIEESKRRPNLVPPQLGGLRGENLHARLKAMRSTDERTIDEIASFFEIDFDDYLRKTKPYLTTSQLVELSAAGFEIGAHSDRHPYFHEIPVEEQKTQIAESVACLRALGLPCRFFAFPFHDGGVPASVYSYMAELDLVLSFGTNAARWDSIAFSFHRFSLDGENARVGVGDILKQLSAASAVHRLGGSAVIRRD